MTNDTPKRANRRELEEDPLAQWGPAEWDNHRSKMAKLCAAHQEAQKGDPPRIKPGATDDELLAQLKSAAAYYHRTPDMLVQAGVDMLEYSRWAIISTFGPYPRTGDEAKITMETLIDWPDWVAEWVPPGSKWERLDWPDGSVTIRLVNPRALVLGAQHFEEWHND